MEYKFNNGACVPVRVHTVVMSAQHKKFENDLEVLRHDMKEKVIKEVIPAHLLDERTIYYLNPCGRPLRHPSKSLVLIIFNFKAPFTLAAPRAMLGSLGVR